jgi:hypothetical protein
MGETQQEQSSPDFDARVRLEAVGSKTTCDVSLPAYRELDQRLAKIEARLTRHGRRLILQTAERAIARDLLAQILSYIRLLTAVPT